MASCYDYLSARQTGSWTASIIDPAAVKVELWQPPEEAAEGWGLHVNVAKRLGAKRLKKGAIFSVGLVLVLGLPALPLSRWAFPGDDLAERIGREAVWWGLGALTLLWVLLVERLPLSSIGLRRITWKTVAWGLAAAILMMTTVILSYAVIFPMFGLEMNTAEVGRITHVPLWLQTATMVRAGVVEEIIFRGYAIERLETLTGSVWAAGIVSAAVFIAVHLGSWGYAQLIVVAFGAATLTVLYSVRRDLPSNMLAHFLTDFVGFMLARLQGA